MKKIIVLSIVVLGIAALTTALYSGTTTDDLTVNATINSSNSIRVTDTTPARNDLTTYGFGSLDVGTEKWGDSGDNAFVLQISTNAGTVWTVSMAHGGAMSDGGTNTIPQGASPDTGLWYTHTYDNPNGTETPAVLSQAIVPASASVIYQTDVGSENVSNDEVGLNLGLKIPATQVAATYSTTLTFTLTF